MKNNRDNAQRPHNLPWNRKKPKASLYQSPAFEVKSIISVYKNFHCFRSRGLIVTAVRVLVSICMNSSTSRSQGSTFLNFSVSYSWMQLKIKWQQVRTGGSQLHHCTVGGKGSRRREGLASHICSDPTLRPFPFSSSKYKSNRFNTVFKTSKHWYDNLLAKNLFQ